MYEKEYASLDLVPAEVRHLYKESGGKYVLIGAGEMKTPEDVSRLTESLRKEREDHKKTKTDLAKFNGLDPEETQTKLDRIDELEAAAGDKLDETKINEIVEARIKTKTAPLEREISTLKSTTAEQESTIETYKAGEKKRAIHDHIRTAAATAKVRDTAVNDVLLIGEHVFDVDESGNVVTKDNVGVTPGVGADIWFTERKESSPHWWPDSKGAGSKGGDGGAGGVNPFSADGWNMTEQGKLYRESPEKATQMAQAAGTTVGGARPVKK